MVIYGVDPAKWSTEWLEAQKQRWRCTNCGKAHSWWDETCPQCGQAVANDKADIMLFVLLKIDIFT